MTPKPMELRTTWASLVNDDPKGQSSAGLMVSIGNDNRLRQRIRFQVKSGQAVRTKIQTQQTQ